MKSSNGGNSLFRSLLLPFGQCHATFIHSLRHGFQTGPFPSHSCTASYFKYIKLQCPEEYTMVYEIWLKYWKCVVLQSIDILLDSSLLPTHQWANSSGSHKRGDINVFYIYVSRVLFGGVSLCTGSYCTEDWSGHSAVRTHQNRTKISFALRVQKATVYSLTHK